MSYILDALRRADAERQLGRAPDLHAQPLPAAVLGEREGRARRPLAWIVAGLATTVAAALLAAWWVLPRWGSPPAPSEPPAATLATPPATPPVTPPLEAARVEPPPVARAKDAVSRGGAVPAAPAPARSALPPLPPPAPPRAAAPAGPPPDAPTAPAATPPPAPATASAADPTPGAVTAHAPPPWRERPDLQRELPPIVFGGSVYSEQASARIVVLNGRVFREGETIMPDLVVDEIRPRGAVLRWRGQRFSLP